MADTETDEKPSPTAAAAAKPAEKPAEKPKTDWTKVLFLDTSKPHSKVYPAEKGAHFEQNGFYFDAKGVLATEWLTKEAEERLERVAKRAKVIEAEKAARAKYLKDHGLTEDDLRDPEEKAPAPEKPGSYDVVGWAVGTAKYRFFEIVAYIEKTYNISGTDRRSIVNALVEKGIAPASAYIK